MPMRVFVVLVCSWLLACGDGGLAERRAAVEATGSVRAALEETISRAEAMARSIADILLPAPLMRPAEEEELRRYLVPAHLARARALGVRAEGDEQVAELLRTGRLIELERSSPYWLVRITDELPGYVVPATRTLLAELATRFQRRLGELGLPAYRLEISSALRTAEAQAALRDVNENAAAGVSAHEYGTTVDIAYTAFPPPAELPESLRVEVPAGLRPHLERVAALALESVSVRKSRELQKILGDVLREAQDEGIVLVTLERLQPVYHVTVARELTSF